MEETYTIVVNRSNPLAAIEEITKRTHDDIINEFVANIPEPIGGIRYIGRGILTDIAKKFGYSSGGVCKLLERSGLYYHGVVPKTANIKQFLNNKNK